jgi:hypothetical protein
MKWTRLWTLELDAATCGARIGERDDSPPYVIISRNENGGHRAELGGLEPICGSGSTQGLALLDLVTDLETIVRTMRVTVGVGGLDHPPRIKRPIKTRRRR